MKIKIILNNLLFYKVHISIIIALLSIACQNNFLQASNINIDSLLAQIDTYKNDTDYIKNLQSIAEFYRTTNPDTAIYYISKAIERAKQKDIFDLYFNASSLLSVIYKFNGKTSKSINLMVEILKMSEEHGDTDKQARCLADLGEHCRATQQFDAGINYLKKAIVVSHNAKDPRWIALAYNRIAAIYFECNELDLTVKYADSSLLQCEKIEFMALIPSNLDILGAVYSKQNNYKNAISIYYKALKLCNQYDREEQITTLINLARAYYYCEQNDSALIYANKAYTYSKNHNILMNKENSGFLLAKIYSAIHDYKNAYFYLDTIANLRDSLFNAANHLQISETITKYETEKKEQEIKNQKLIIRNKEINNYFLFASVVFLLGVFIGSIIFITKIRKKNKLLNDRNCEIQTQRDELQFFANELEKTNNIKDRFFSIIAHDLKSPFNSLLGLSDLLNDSIENYDKDDIKQISDAINKASNKAFNLLVNLLNWSQTQTNRIKYNPTEINITEIIQSNIDLHESIAKSKSLNIKFEPKEDVQVYADINMLDTILRNLMSNAIKFTENGNIEIQVNINSTHCEVSIQDSGIGISEASLQKLFQLDQNISTKGTRGESGTGLGLILCKEFIERNNGTIKVESTLNEGSIFSISIPLAS
ncbi:MAG: tetratricopeptide repeat-containing sensor histidine kinase [Bacteroidetes bacterium]|jgi:signal transduction histidine kinase|nr:tetratricopeptide repeat-containing sensor histidine kinase [Bacteroidota bacterium]MBT6685255.1 tetratricopeptide repeat-containing sensor histidine kinase [Bacteroidota bacterium]MBT7144251.1 tetratricopeptide repeat-containing sensor histidine kinase [Bacteroidota bacterium]MBT7490818.1 tetratricopeptide repeat-containing sensor histidine kinase [Bacteroidota bacterium]